MNENKTTTVEMTAEEQAQYAAFKQDQARKAAEAKAQAEREQYRELVDEELERSIPILQAISGDIKACKAQVMDNFKAILEMKSELFKTKSRMASVVTPLPIARVIFVSRWASM